MPLENYYLGIMVLDFKVLEKVSNQVFQSSYGTADYAAL